MTQERMRDVERINKETGELSASGELSVSLELKGEAGTVGGAGGQTVDCRGPRPLLALREQLHQLETHNLLPPSQREEHLCRVLPLYIQVCEDGDRGMEAVDLRALAAVTAETMVTHILSRLAERPAEDARYEVQLFFQKSVDRQKDQRDGEDRQTDVSGWMLLKGLCLLTAQGPEVQSLVKPGLPAALIKCLYLLVSLPAKRETCGGERSFQELLIQVLLQLSQQQASVEEMVDTAELQCLIIALTSLWDQTSAPWRHQAGRILRAVSAAQARNTVTNLQAKNCVRICTQNLQGMCDRVPGHVLAELAVSVFSFVRDSFTLSHALFKEFETNDGYTVLQAIMTRCEEGVSGEDFQPVQELLGLLASLCLLGKNELKVALCVSNPQPPGFKFVPSLTNGLSVKNLSAFRLLQTSFLRSEDMLLCCHILRTIRTVWEWDSANFFLLEWSVQSLAQLATCVWRKPAPVHKLFFSMVEMVVFQLNYIPHEVLHAVQGVLKQSWIGGVAGSVAGAEFEVMALDCFYTLTVRSGLLSDVLSEGGLLEMVLLELKRRAKILRKAGASATGLQEHSGVENGERALTTSMLNVVAALTLRSVRNTVSVRELGMVPYMKIFLDEEQYRGPTLAVLEQLCEVNPEEFMSTAIGALCSSTQHELGLKQDLLQSVLKVLENPNSWDAFRRAGGFSGLLSLVVDMEGALADPPRPQGGVWGSLGDQMVLDLLLLTLHTLAVAVHVHPVNAHHFQTGGFYEKLAEALAQLGCFWNQGPGQQDWAETGDWPRDPNHSQRALEDSWSQGKSFHQFVELAETPLSSSSPEPPLPPRLQACVRLLSYLDQFSTGTWTAHELGGVLGREGETQGAGGGEPTPRPEEPQGGSRNPAYSVSSIGSQSNYRFTCDQTILYPGAVRVMMTLLPAVFTLEDTQLSMEVQFSVAHHIQAMVMSERNRQIMCEAGLVSTLLTHCQVMLLQTHHPLHLPVTRILEKLSSHSISKADLRRFLCLGEPLMCSADKIAALPPAPETHPQCTPSVSNGQSPDLTSSDEQDQGGVSSAVKQLKRSFSLLGPTPPSGPPAGSPIPLHQIISLVSMTSPRSLRPHRVSASPAFVEFDMNDSGFGCLFLPSVATVKGVNADSIPTGGIGGDCRGFPPAAGLSFSCWFLVSRFTSACNSHPVRLLSVIRHMSRAEHQYTCLSISFSASDGCLVISTEEEPFTFLDMMESEVCTPSPLPTSVRFRCSSQLVPGQWHHLTVVMAKDVKKSCRVSAYLNGKLVGGAKMRYVQPFPGQYASMDPTAVIDVCAFIGTPSLWKELAALVWRVGPTYLFEEVLSLEAVSLLYAQGTAYIGNYLDLRSTGPGDDPPPLRLIPEERIAFAINPAIATVTTVAQIREDYNEVDSRLIAKEIGIPSRDSSAPVFLARNISQHLAGTARTIGAALVGHFGVRTFAPTSAANGFLYVGGPAVILSLVAMAPDDGSLYAAVKVLLSVLETCPAIAQEMKRFNGYKLLAFLLKVKSVLVSSRTFQLVLSLSGSVEMGSGPACLRNKLAFQALLCDLEVWQNSSDNLELAVLNHFADILKSSSDGGGNAEVMHSLGLVPKLLFLLSDPLVTPEKVKVVTCIITRQLRAHFSCIDIRRLGLFLVFTLPPVSVRELPGLHDNSSDGDTPVDQASGAASPVWVRNQLLLCVCDLLSSEKPMAGDQQKELFQTLGSDWFLLFLQPHLHTSTLQLGLFLLTHLLTNHSERNRFRESVLPGSLMERMEEPSGTVIDNLRGHSWSSECLSVPCPGFDVLRRLLVQLAHLPQVYGALAALLLGRTTTLTPDPQEQVDLDEVLQKMIDSLADTPPGKQNRPLLQLCPEAASTLLELVKVIITQPSSVTKGSWELQFPGSVMQFLCLLHSVCPRDPLWMSAEFLGSLASTVYPLHCPEDGGQLGEGSEGEGSSRGHPTRKQVCDFIRILLMDSLLNISARDHTHPLLLLLEYTPEGASLEQRQSFQTELLEFLMDIIHMISHQEETHTHLSQQDSTIQSADLQMSTLMENVAFLSKKLIEKLHSCMFLVEPETLLTFLADQIVVAMEKGQAQKESTVTTLYKCTNRAVLHFLSRPRNSPSDQEMVLRALRVVMARWDVIMATYNSSVSFVTCLLHCLLLIRSGSYPEGFGGDLNKKHHRRLLSRLFPRKASLSTAPSPAADSATDVSERMALVESCWLKIMMERRHTLEDTYKIDLSANQMARAGPVTMSDISPLWEEMALKAWQIYIESQKRQASSSPQKKAGLIMTAVRAAQKQLGREAGSVEEFMACMETHRQRGKEFFESMRRRHTQLRGSEWERVASQWLSVEEELLRERGVFGPGPGVVLTRAWVQDAAEGPNRTRPRIRSRALRGSKRLAAVLGQGDRPSGSEESRSRAGTGSDQEPRILCEAGAEAVEEEEEEEEEGGGERLTFFPVLSETVASPEPPEPHTPEPCSHTHSCSDTHVILHELDPGEQIKDKMSVVVVSGLSVTEGVLLFGNESLYICEGFTLSPAGDVCCRKHHPTSVRDSYMCSLLNKEQGSPHPACRRWPYEDIKDARFMRYLLKDNALEVFMRIGYSAFLVFLNKDHVSAYKRLCSVVPSLRGRGVAEVLTNTRKTPMLEKMTLVRWQRGEMSNFEYLMHLNTLAGRTYSDLMQYPVFPWVLADYESETLDLSNPATFRDLSRPMGAQTEKRRKMFIERYNDEDNSDGDLLARCHYCTHYSSAIIVASFLVRMEPFSHTFQTLQGGFDVPERMFHSVKKEWDSASRDNMGDVRELIPEFYYLPDFLLNSNHFQLGCMEDGTALWDVVLPPWAKGDPQEFIRVHREALESEYVSNHLHLWIDLIFGHRQLGPAAVESLNTFHPYFYAPQRPRSQDALLDPLIRNTILGYVSNFGQVPKQLFSKPHPPRSGSKKEAPASTNPTPFFFKLDKLKPSVQPFKELLRGSVGQVLCLEKEVLVLEKNHLLLPPLFTTFFCWGFPDNSCAFGSYSTEKIFAVCESLCDWGETLCAACPNQTTVVTSGTSTVVCVWDVVVSKEKLIHMKLRQALYGHTDSVTCVAVSEVHSVIVSGSEDHTCILWDLEELSYVAQLSGHEAGITALAVNDLTGEIASCAASSLYLWSMKGQLLTWLNTSYGPSGNISCVCFTQRNQWDARNVIVTGCADGIIRIWRTEYTRAPPALSVEEPSSSGLEKHEPDSIHMEEGVCKGAGWERYLVLCRELNRSQAVSRRRYKNNPAITALAMSRTHATLLVGDAWGRVFTWTCE
ncbi:WD repeat- and FYVE domain-containing protein 4 isoform X1 [Osmerus eperlanus]|uniref:WD repeat- and FYVE domain-containing protein 4 isoform X1 n=1 Tax=Osmerus eperlanus TaxID=29151 RepID=UPI002E137D60